MNKGRSNHIIGVIYRHPTLGVDMFTDEYMSPFVAKISKEKNKNITIAGDFNINLLNLSHTHSSEFLTYSHQTIYYQLSHYPPNSIQVVIIR